MNLFNIAQGGLSAAQSALNVVGNNLSNATTEGYSRQNIILGEAGGRTTRNGFFGYGVQTNDVKRSYDAFLNNQVRGATSQFQAQQGRYEQLSQIDDMLGDDTDNVSNTLGNAFGAMEKMSSDPVSGAARQEVLSQYKALANQYRSNSNTLNGLEKSTNTKIGQAVDDINSCAKQLASLNQQIAKVQAGSGSLPSDLLDQRDQMLGQLSSLTGIRVNENSTTGRVDVTLANGYSLVNGDSVCALQAQPSPEDPNKTVVSYIDASGNAMRLDEDRMSEGSLGGLFSFRNTDLPDARNQLNQLALQMANKFNEVNKAGYDLNGDAGGDLFSLADPQALANRNNAGDASLAITRSDTSAVNAQDYTMTFTGPSASDWSVTTRDGRTITPTLGDDGSLSFDGLTVKPQGTPEANDSFVFNPVSGAADSISVAIDDGDKIAASSSSDASDESNNENIKKMIDIKNQQVIGNSTLSEAYARLSSSVGSAMTSLDAGRTTASNVASQWQQQQQSVAGVDINEEYINLQMYTQYYQANAQVLQTATSLFDTLLNIK
ncbi:flagellar hook-associated protein 1 FlgK [Enterobacter sp. BIGb0383]|uniref:flagellar hook-associated protein FlgK n=1 Tax=unclassified Enterobacter TaxID=2608935 RepID=UPI000F47142D|nr:MULTISPECIES: flagellar hook-associated protein FlgK [unclassified Enterobacter]ROP58307.1 flagellar hook-associated protein 1 FlgK [Enterobacter sp. BIGb0383]ROS06805.1 flagellar hook-associated protein 1 FlgK [Enterobacter sp. BIGb0359]